VRGPYVKASTGEDMTSVIVSAEADLIAPITALCWEIGPDLTRDVVLAALDAGSARAWERKRCES